MEFYLIQLFVQMIFSSSLCDSVRNGRMGELSIKELGCNSYSLKVGKYYFNLDIK